LRVIDFNLFTLNISEFGLDFIIRVIMLNVNYKKFAIHLQSSL